MKTKSIRTHVQQKGNAKNYLEVAMPDGSIRRVSATISCLGAAIARNLNKKIRS